MIIAEHNNAFCDVKFYGDEQILMEQLINIIKALAIRLNKDKITILEVLECYFFLEEENRKNKTFRNLFKQFFKDTRLSIQGELYLYNKKNCVLYKNKNNSEYLIKSASKKKKVSEPYKGEKKSETQRVEKKNKLCKGENKQRKNQRNKG